MKISSDTQIHQQAFTSRKKPEQTFPVFRELAMDENIEANLSDIIADEKNYISEGMHNRVFSIPNNSDFVIKTSKFITPENIMEHKKELEPVEDAFQELNVGQSIGHYGSDIAICVRQSGEEYGIPRAHKLEPHEADLEKYLSDIRKLSAMGDDSYVNFSEEVKEIYDKGCYIDFMNANNIMTTENEINSVDLIKIRRAKQKILLFPSKDSFLKIFFDYGALPFVEPKLKETEKKELGENMAVIMEKIDTGMKRANLPESPLRTQIINKYRDVFMHAKNGVFYGIIEKLVSMK